MMNEQLDNIAGPSQYFEAAGGGIIVRAILSIFTALVGLACSIWSAQAEVTHCLQITSLPAVINQQGVHCLKGDLSTAMASGNAITINVNNVTIDLNGYKLGGLNAPNVVGIYALDRQNLIVRNGSIRGFAAGLIVRRTLSGESSGHLIEDLRIEAARAKGIELQATHSTIRNSLIRDVGDSTTPPMGIQRWGIDIYGSTNTIEGNKIVNLNAGQNQAIGINVENSSFSVIKDNQISSLGGLTIHGIRMNGVRNVISGNTIMNGTAGTYGIVSSSGALACLNNVISNFNIALSGCTKDAGNQTF